MAIRANSIATKCLESRTGAHFALAARHARIDPTKAPQPRTPPPDARASIADWTFLKSTSSCQTCRHGTANDPPKRCSPATPEIKGEGPAHAGGA